MALIVNFYFIFIPFSTIFCILSSLYLEFHLWHGEDGVDSIIFMATCVFLLFYFSCLCSQHTNYGMVNTHYFLFSFKIIINFNIKNINIILQIYKNKYYIDYNVCFYDNNLKYTIYILTCYIFIIIFIINILYLINY